MLNTSEQFYTLEEAAAKLDCNTRVLSEKLRTNEVKGYKRLTKWYVLHSDLVEYIKSGKSGKTPA